MKWISVKEKLPELYIPVLVCDKRRRVCVRAYCGFQFEHHSWTRNKTDVTHWMPLPEPPKEDE